MFNAEQNKALSAPLSSSHIKTRPQAGRNLSYIEGWHAIAEANRIFGYDAWDRETVDILKLGEPHEVDGKWRVSFMARVRITVRADGATIVRDGCGYGSGIDRDIGSSHESALKEAETDAMKRALMTFGNPFGLALYDKAQAGVEREPQGGSVITKAQTETILDLIAATGSNIEIFCKHFGIEAVPEMPSTKFDEAISALNRKKKKAA